MKNRNVKIRFLKGLVTGQRSISEIRPRRVILLIKHEGSSYSVEASQEKTRWTEEDIQNHLLKYPRDRFTTILIKRKW